MKCDNCGAVLDLEQERCPYCGELNLKARQHVEDMKRYQGAFEDTKRKVDAATTSYAKASTKMRLIIVLAILFVIAFVINANAWDIARAIRRYKVGRNSEEKIAVMDSYIEKGDFLGLNSYCEKEYITYNEIYEEYRTIIDVSVYYEAVYYSIMTVEFWSEDTSYRTIEECREVLAEDIGSFYNRADIENYSYYENYDSDKNQEAIAAMTADVERLLQTYCNLTKEDVAELAEMTDGRIEVLLEERMQDEE